MNYTELKENIARICENEFTEAEYALFTEQAEQRIYNTVQIANLRKNVTGSITASNQYLQAPYRLPVGVLVGRVPSCRRCV
jgi:hypothetical protein